jgi:sortase B
MYTLTLNDKIFKKLCHLYDDAVLLLCLIFLLIGGYTCYDSYQLYYHSQDKSLLKYKPQISEDGTITNPAMKLSDLVGWVTIDNTNIDYPIMQGTNNTVYLNTDPYGEYSLSGSIFLDSRNNSDFTDYYNLVYGHHMENGYMFGALDKFEDVSYFNSHRTGTLIITNGTTSGRVCNLNIFAVVNVNANTKFFEIDEKDLTYDDIVEYAEIFEQPKNTSSNVLALSTCQSNETIGRLIVFAEIIETTKTQQISETEGVTSESKTTESDLPVAEVYVGDY